MVDNKKDNYKKNLAMREMISSPDTNTIYYVTG